MRSGSLLTLVLVMLTAGAVLLTLQNFERAGHRSAAAESPPATPRYTLKSAEWTRLDAEGQLEFVANAQLIEYFDDQSLRLQQPEVHAFGGSGSPWRLTAPEGSTPAHSRNLLLTGPVLAMGRWPDGEELGINTEHLWLDVENKVLRTDADVTLSSATRKVLASGLIADSMGQRIELLSKVRAAYAPRS